jgi:preprotein translocase subunit SecA
MVVTTRLRYVYLAARLLEERSPQWVTEDVQEHLEEAQEKMALVWGMSEWSRLDTANLTINQMDRSLDAFLQAALPAEKLEAIQDIPLGNLNPDDRQGVTLALGLRVMNEIYRQLLLSVISELWVDYLTQVEALRVSIGLEAYAQRDPLVQYKSKATELFSKLLSDIRAGVISRMYVYRPRVAGSVQIEKEPVAAVPVPGDGRPAPDGSHPTAQEGRGTKVTAAPPAVRQESGRPGGGKPGSGSRRKRHRH